MLKILQVKVQKIKTTIFSNGYGAKFTDNSILLKIKKNKYIFISHIIFSFTSKSEIKKFISLIGNNNIPYPYAIDIDD